MKIYDSLIVGAGPAGSTLAGQLAKNSFSVLVLEGNKSLKRKVCGEYLCPLGVKLLKDKGLASVLDPFIKVLGMKIYSPKGIEVDATFPETDTFCEKGVSLNRSIFDNSLVDYAKDQGAEILFDSLVKDFSFNGTFWEVHDYKGNTYRARLLIGADGVRSKVAKKLNLTLKSETKRVAIHCWKRGEFNFERKGEMHLFTGGSYIGVDPITNSEVNLSLVCDASLIKEFKTPRDILNSYIQKSVSLRKSVGGLNENEEVFTISPITHRVKQAITHQAALVGDAAGFVDPLTGEGIFNAIWMSMKLSECLVKERNSLFDFKESLESYEKIRVDFFREKTNLNRFFQWLIHWNFLLNLVALFLRRKKSRADSFVGIIGNIYKPLTGLLKILR
ncbi:hypothetical protein A9Q84_03205 [Halobacteriovorax marinus]|uniref:FAD-binding domain-containing protein n=1 Tax=Halobacteriovorax marinus TaxID=97084 RepID=A0A1Y5FJM6_9BACT|nr:hypothetical protein A9Q84_03205 [Halobacteriovorax marinus]